MSFEVIVFAMRLTSFLVERVSAMTICVPSFRTTRSKGVIKSANGKLSKSISIHYLFSSSRHSRDAFDNHECNVSIRSNTGTGPFYVVLRQASLVISQVHPSQKPRNSLDCTSNQLSEVPRHNPQSQILSTSARRCKRHDGTSFGDIPATGANTGNGTTEDEILQSWIFVSCVLWKAVCCRRELTHWFPNLLLQ